MKERDQPHWPDVPVSAGCLIFPLLLVLDKRWQSGLFKESSHNRDSPGGARLCLTFVFLEADGWI